MNKEFIVREYKQGQFYLVVLDSDKQPIMLKMTFEELRILRDYLNARILA
jgi:hypothetical protein